MFLILLNQLMTSLVFSHWLTLVAFRRFRFILSSVALLILPSLFLLGLLDEFSGCLKNFLYGLSGWWSNEPRFGLRGLCFALCFPKQKSSISDQRFHWRILQGIFPVNATRKWRHLFVWIPIHCHLFVIRYILWLKIAVRHETLSIKT